MIAGDILTAQHVVDNSLFFLFQNAMGSSSATSYQASGIVPPVNSATSSRVSLVIHGPGPHDHLDGVSSEDITIAHGLLAGSKRLFNSPPAFISNTMTELFFSR